MDENDAARAVRGLAAEALALLPPPPAATKKSASDDAHDDVLEEDLDLGALYADLSDAQKTTLRDTAAGVASRLAAITRQRLEPLAAR